MARTAYCTGCGFTFVKMHEMMRHRGTFRCGGRFLPVLEQRLNRAAKYLKDIGYSEMSNSVRIDRDRLRHDRGGATTMPPLRHKLPRVERLTNDTAAYERKRVNRVRIGLGKKRAA